MTRTPVLEPIRPALLLVCLAHLVLAGLIAWYVWRQPEFTFLTPAASGGSAPADDTQWFDPAEFQSSQPAPAQTATTAPSPTASPPAPSAARFITLSRFQTATPAPGSGAPLSARDLSALDRLDQALYEAFMRFWQPPAAGSVAPAQRSLRLDLSLNPDLTLTKIELAQPSGSLDFDISVLDAAEKVRQWLSSPPTERATLHFPERLPSPFQNSRYDCRVQFQVE